MKSFIADFLGTTAIVLVLSWYFGWNPLGMFKEVIAFYVVIGLVAVGGGLALMIAIQRAMNPKIEKKEQEQSDD